MSKKKPPLIRVIAANLCDKMKIKKIRTVMRMKLVNICLKCNGKGKIRSKLPFFKKTCTLCNGTGKRQTTIKDSKRA
ncbi:hypothetical protein AZ46_0221380 [Metabacillus indicus LMG 22858]|nr:hypothetical protein AZ46_0221380 [Metabacillus indicus LMG 22858]